MLDQLRGKLIEKKAGLAVIEVAGFGLKVRMAIPAFLALPEPPNEAVILTRLVIREESWEIFGFLSPAEREAFDILTSVSRVGPRLALTVLSSLDPGKLATILINQDLPALASIKGLGPKTAERLLVELKEKALKLAAMSGGPVDQSAQERSLVLEEAVQALINLGYNRAESEKTVARLKPAVDADLGTVIKDALKALNS
ncbi:MAG: Holliday junction branch migration protein RuvA [Deltaproteobacteria bacterium]|jgi:Holliday junction DNA helicase RuvA|nr:Holliday junction branch migration protein RuvA [Deltaproteobacteria bacterium]